MKIAVHALPAVAEGASLPDAGAEVVAEEVAGELLHVVIIAAVDVEAVPVAGGSVAVPRVRDQAAVSDSTPLVHI